MREIKTKSGYRISKKDWARLGIYFYDALNLLGNYGKDTPAGKAYRLIKKAYLIEAEELLK